MHYQIRKARLCAGFPFCDKLRSEAPALTLMEMVIALSIMAIVFTAVLPEFRAIQNSWDSKAGAAEALQNGRVLMDHLYHDLSKAARITAVSDSAESNGYIEFEDNAGSTLRYDIGENSYVAFGPVGSLSELAGPVSQLQFTCYDACDLDTPIMDVNSIRFVKVETTLTNSAAMGRDKTLTTQVYLRTNSSSGAGSETVRDEFNAISYSGNDGSQNWSNNWQEWGELNGPTSGAVMVVNSPSGLSSMCLRFGVGQKDKGVSRVADLSEASSATLTFQWRRSGEYYSNKFTVEISKDSSSWYELLEIPDGYETSVHSESFDISSYISSNTEVRFIPKDWGDGYLYVDEVQIEYAGGGGQILP